MKRCRPFCRNPRQPHFFIGCVALVLACALCLVAARPLTASGQDGSDPMDFMCSELPCGPYEVFGQQVARDGSVTYCLDQNSPGPHVKQWTSFNRGWEWVNDERAAIVHNAYPCTTSIGGHQLSEGNARAATQLALWMLRGTTSADGIHKGKNYTENFGGTAEKEEILTVARWLVEKAKSGEITAPRNRTRMYYAVMREDKGEPTQNLLYVMPTVDVTITKESCNATVTTGNGNYSLSGAEFDIFDSTDTKVASIKTDADGQATLKLAPSSSYYAVETKAPAGFGLSKQRFEFTTGANGASPHFGDHPKVGRVTVRKKDEATGNSAQVGASLVGAEFEAVSKSTPGWSQRAKTNSEQRAVFTDVPLGSLEIREVKAPEGYLIDTTVHKLEVKEGSDDVIDLDLAASETPIAFDLEISKFKSDSSSEGSKVEQAAGGIRFNLISNTSGKVVGSLTTNDCGFADTKSQKGAWFGAGKRPEGAAGAIPYDRAGYTVHEVESTVPSGFAHVADWIIDAKSLQNGAKLQFIVNNSDIRTHLQIVKLDASTGTTVPLKGFSFKILDEAGEVVTQDCWYPNKVALDTFTTDKTGTVTLPQSLRAGTYRIKETAAAAPYLLNSEDATFTIPSDASLGQVCLVSVTDAPATGKLEICKTDAVDGSALAGAEFDIFADEDIVAADGYVQAACDQLIGHITCDENGYAALADLPLGCGEARYRIIETVAPDGYLINAESEKVTLSYKDAQTAVVSKKVQIKNDYTKIDVSKTDITGKEELPGAELIVYNSDGCEVDRWISTDQPHRIEHLIPGTYRLCELKTPRQYDQAESVEFAVEASGEVQTAAMKDSPIKVEGRIDKRQEIAVPTAKDTTVNGDGENKADANGEQDGTYRYTIDFENASSTWVDEFTCEDDLTCASADLAELQAIETPQAQNDYDGLLNVWYLTDKCEKTEIQDAETNEYEANATHDDGHENPWLSDADMVKTLGKDGRALEYTGWKLWKRDISATKSEKLSVHDLKLEKGEKIISIRFEYGRVESGFSTRRDKSILWDREDLLDEHDDLNGVSEDMEESEEDGFDYRPAVITTQVTDAYKSGTTLENDARVHLFRNGGGEELEDHKEDRVIQTAAEVTTPAERSKEDESAPGAKLLQTGGCDPTILVPAATVTIAAACGLALIFRKRL